MMAQNKTPKHMDLSFSQFQDYIAHHPSALLIDVRTHEEFAEGHLPGAVNISITESSFDSKMSQYSKEEPVLVYCRSGHRSTIACNRLLSLGFIEVKNLTQGITGWQAAGGKTVK